MNKIINTDIVIIGGGLTGLTTAHHLNKAGKEFLILEKENRVGGVINTSSEGGFLYEEGPNTGVISNGDVIDLFDDLKDHCELEIADKSVNKRYILKNGKWEALPSGFRQAVKTPLFTLKDKFRILGEPFRAKGKNPHETLANLVKRRMGQSFLDYAIDPFILGVYAGDPELLIPKYALPKLYNLEQNYGSFIKGAFKKKFENKSEHEKKATKKIFSVKGGLGNLTDALCKSIGKEKFILGSDNISVVPENGSYTITAESQGEKITIKANKIISSTGAYALDKTLPFIDKESINKLTSLVYTKVIEVVIGFNKWDGISLDGFGGLIPFKEKRDILGVLFLSSFLKDKAPEDGALLTIFIGGVRRAELTELNDEEIKGLVKRESLDLMGIKEFNPDLFKIIRHNKAIPQYGIESGERFEEIKKLQKDYPGLIIGGNLRDGIGMADRIKQGKELAMSVL